MLDYGVVFYLVRSFEHLIYVSNDSSRSIVSNVEICYTIAETIGCNARKLALKSLFSRPAKVYKACCQHQYETRQDEAQPCKDASDSASTQATEEHAKLRGFWARKGLVNSKHALKPRKRNPFLFDNDLLFDLSDLSDWATPKRPKL